MQITITRYFVGSVRVTALMLLSVMFTVIGCDRSSGQNATGKPRVVATTTMIGDLVKRIGGDKIDVVVLMPAGVDPHSFKPSTADMGEVARAKLVFYNGLHLEGKMIELLEDKLAGRAFAVSRDIPIDRLLSWADGQSGAHDPHIWFDPTLWTMAAKVVETELSKIDPANAAVYAANASNVASELAQLHAENTQKLSTIPKSNRVLITSHDAFNYFGRAYDIEVRGLQGISTETQAGLSAITAAVDHIVKAKIPAIFVESSVPHATIERVQADCKSRGFEVKIGGELYSDAMGAPGEHPGYAVETYAGMMRYNVDLIVRGLK